MIALAERRPDFRERLHISYSQISTYLLCPLKFQLQYVVGAQPEFVSVALPLGSAVHEAIALLYQTLRLTGEPPSLRELQESFASHWEQQETSGRDYVRLKPEESWAGLKDLGSRLIETYFGWVKAAGFPDPQDIAAIEQPLSVPVDGMDFVGIVDLIIRDRRDRALFHLIDHKTAARRYDEAKISSDPQMTAYRFLVETSRFLPEDSDLTLNWDVLLKTKKPAVERFTTVRSPEDVQRFLKIVRAVLRAIDREAFFPNPGWLCGDCGYQGLCTRW